MIDLDKLSNSVSAIFSNVELIELLNNPVEIEQKSENDFVSSTDKDLERHFKLKLQLILDVEVFGEETMDTPMDDNYWVVDPLDGTSNFLNGIEPFCSSIALVLNKEPALGVIHNFSNSTTYIATKNGGSKKVYRKGSRARTKSLPLNKGPVSLVAVSSGFMARVDHLQLKSSLENFLGEVNFRNFGTQALHGCLVAEGSLDASFSEESHAWDDLAAALLVQEASGQSLRIHGVDQKFGSVVRQTLKEKYGTCFFSSRMISMLEDGEAHSSIENVLDEMILGKESE